MCLPKTVRILRTAPAGFYPVCLPAFTGDKSGNSNSNSAGQKKKQGKEQRQKQAKQSNSSCGSNS